jgi:hypothetical protein
LLLASFQNQTLLLHAVTCRNPKWFEENVVPASLYNKPNAAFNSSALGVQVRRAAAASPPVLVPQSAALPSKPSLQP